MSLYRRIGGPLPSRLPREIWDVVEGYDIGRLLFIFRAVSQLEKLKISSVNNPETKIHSEKVNVEERRYPDPFCQFCSADLCWRSFKPA